MELFFAKWHIEKALIELEPLLYGENVNGSTAAARQAAQQQLPLGTNRDALAQLLRHLDNMVVDYENNGNRITDFPAILASANAYIDTLKAQRLHPQRGVLTDFYANRPNTGTAHATLAELHEAIRQSSWADIPPSQFEDIPQAGQTNPPPDYSIDPDAAQSSADTAYPQAVLPSYRLIEPSPPQDYSSRFNDKYANENEPMTEEEKEQVDKMLNHFVRISTYASRAPNGPSPREMAYQRILKEFKGLLDEPRIEQRPFREYILENLFQKAKLNPQDYYVMDNFYQAKAPRRNKL